MVTTTCPAGFQCTTPTVCGVTGRPICAACLTDLIMMGRHEWTKREAELRQALEDLSKPQEAK